MKEETKMNMEIVQVDGEPVDIPEEPEKEPEVQEVEKKSIFRRIGGAVLRPAKYAVRKIKESPASAAVGGLIGGAVTLGGKILYDHWQKGHIGPMEIQTDFIDDEPESSAYEEEPDNVVPFEREDEAV